MKNWKVCRKTQFVFPIHIRKKKNHKNTIIFQRVYQSHGSSNLFFFADREKVHSETKLKVSKLTDAHNKLKNWRRNIAYYCVNKCTMKDTDCDSNTKSECIGKPLSTIMLISSLIRWQCRTDPVNILHKIIGLSKDLG